MGESLSAGRRPDGRPLFGRKVSVRPGTEFRRIVNLPRRDWDPTITARMTEVLKTHEGQQLLRDIQAQALYEIGLYGGLFGPIRVGAGKTLISLLAPRVCDAKRPLLLLPAGLIEKTKREQATLSKSWRVSKHLRIESYESLGRVSSQRMLEIYKPDFIIADECHRLKNKRAGVTRRVARWMFNNPDTKFAAMSGTVMSDSLRDFAHIIAWTHKNKSPCPLDDETVQEWCDALDLKVNPLARKDPGALLEFSQGLLGDPLSRARKGFHRRLVDTAGVVASAETQEFTGSLLIRTVEYKVNAETEKNFKTLRTLWETPDGWSLTEAVAVWRHARELALGLHYVWDPRPPDSWLAARRAWAKFVRDFLSRSKKLDTELQVANAVAEGILDDGGLLCDWKAIQPTFNVNSQPRWHDFSAVELAVKWLKEHPNGICWSEHKFFSDELARRSGCLYFGNGGLAASGQRIEDARGAIIASIAANGTGRNLQRWDSNLITSLPGGLGTEQLIARTHRPGQNADEVAVDILLGCREHHEAIVKAVSAAHMQEDTLGQTQKLLLADLEYPLSIVNKPGFRWSKNKNGKCEGA